MPPKVAWRTVLNIAHRYSFVIYDAVRDSDGTVRTTNGGSEDAAVAMFGGGEPGVSEWCAPGGLELHAS